MLFIIITFLMTVASVAMVVAADAGWKLYVGRKQRLEEQKSVKLLEENPGIDEAYAEIEQYLATEVDGYSKDKV